ncbi:transglutaminase family protein [Teichococcus vastitatis]|uniref:Transglutaminase family protein n=1 Tax=Teichococcus vastitatis TaxID=2307076 RepID=A0ABS9W122_9PROT|nr:transglutaminase family protein [Pseudoroseomonas vastitatis]MCI0752738.1 transglutaminase family protein [Pseudoroseomonas vastitatis]
MIWRVRHTTGYRYARPVDLASHMLHLTPRDLAWQRVLWHRLRCTPEPARISHSRDHFGNPVTWLFMEQPHDTFEVVTEAEVEVVPQPLPRAADTLRWEAVVQAARRDPAAAEFTFPSPLLPETPGATAYAAACFPPGQPVLAGLLALNGRVHRDFLFRGGATSISTPVSEVLARREGVCQDFTHLMVCGLRGLGLPARYMSGYIRTRPPPGEARRIGADQSHAWVAAWLGAEHGWVDLDPTNDLLVSTEHVALGWGRDFGDVSPLRGIILGGGRHSLHVGVNLRPAADAVDDPPG